MNKNEFQKWNPFRRPTWRFERVLKLVEHRPRPLPASRTRDDDYIRKYRKFVLKLGARNNPEDQVDLFPKFPEMFWAHHLYHHPDKEWTYYLQARILARMSDEEVADEINVLPGAIFWFEKIFFNVRDRLHARDYITKMVIGKPEDRIPSVRDGRLSDYQKQMSYKLFGYFGGPLVLDVMVHGFSTLPFPNQVDRCGEWYDNALAMLVRRHATEAARHFEMNKYNVMQLLELHMRLTEAAASEGTITDYERNVEQALSDITWKLASQVTEEDQSVLEGEFSVKAIEPRASEHLALARGEMPPELAAASDLQLLPTEEQS